MRRSVGRLGIGEARGPLHWAPDREASLVKKEYCRCGPLPPQVTSPRARPPHARERATLSPPPEFRGRPLWLMVPIALQGSHQPAPEAAPGAPLHSEAPTRVWEGMPRDRGPTWHVEAGRWGLLRPTAHGLLGQRHTRAPTSATWLGEAGAGSIEIPGFLGWGARACAQIP